MSTWQKWVIGVVVVIAAIGIAGALIGEDEPTLNRQELSDALESIDLAEDDENFITVLREAFVLGYTAEPFPGQSDASLEREARCIWDEMEPELIRDSGLIAGMTDDEMNSWWLREMANNLDVLDCVEVY